MRRALLTSFGRHLIRHLDRVGALTITNPDQLRSAVDDAVDAWLKGPRGDR